MTAKDLLFTSESVTEGHPDKMCDQISDAILDACFEQDPRSRVACEAATKSDFVLLFGEITTDARVDYDEVARKVIQEIGYDDSSMGFDGKTCTVQISISEQSSDIAQGVDHSFETRSSEVSEEEVASIGAGDQGMMFGFACNETETLMPLPIHLSHNLARRLAEVRKAGDLPWLRPDGKSQVTVEYENGKPKRVDTVLISTQHAPDISAQDIHDGVVEHIIRPVLPEELLDDNLRIFVNPTGRFVVGGPMGDSGLTGRKIIVDTYGGMGRHGGGCFSGKDPTKVDRSGAYAARWVAKHIVGAGIAERCEIQVAYAIGVAHPVSVNVETFGTGRLGASEISEIVNQLFDLRPGAIIRDLKLRHTRFLPTACYGHFGRDDLDLPWEKLSRLQEVKSLAGVDSTVLA
ncbi:MAG: methionine adenosyltransferase [Chloroflexi bacterium]|nr:methionine adenosyltransferase [Chloroflexota bacterium]